MCPILRKYGVTTKQNNVQSLWTLYDNRLHNISDVGRTALHLQTPTNYIVYHTMPSTQWSLGNKCNLLLCMSCIHLLITNQTMYVHNIVQITCPVQCPPKPCTQPHTKQQTILWIICNVMWRKQCLTIWVIHICYLMHKHKNVPTRVRPTYAIWLGECRT